MAKPLRYTCYLFGILLSLSAVAPLPFGVFNLGSVVLAILAAFFLALPRLWKFLSGFLPLRRVLTALGLLFLLYCASVSSIMAYKAWWNKPPSDGVMTVIVLGAKINGDQPSLMLSRRLSMAASYLKTNPEAVVVVTGGQGNDEDYPEAHVMASYLENLGISPERISIEDQSSNTRGNFTNTHNLGFVSDGSPVLIVTDGFHQFRAWVFAQSVLKDAGDMYAISSLTPWGLMPAYWAREFMGIPVAWLQTL